MPPAIDPNKIVIFTGAGISAESGINTFRGPDGTWTQVDPMKVASTMAWHQNPEAVLDFHNNRLANIEAAEPNAAHRALAELEHHFEVVVITQNIDDLHERGGSTKVLHLHGTALKVSGVAPADAGSVDIVDRGFHPIRLGDTDESGRQLRPCVVWFGEEILHHDEAGHHLATAARILVIGTSLTVYPAAGLLHHARHRAEKVLVAHEVEQLPYGFRFLDGNATQWVPQVVARWIEAGPAVIPSLD